MASVQNVTGLSNEQIKQACPSVFALSKHESRSSRFGFVPTNYVLNGLREIGLVPTQAVQCKSRIEGKEAFTKHMLRLRRVEDLGNTKPDVIEIVLKNAHDGTAAYELMLGIFRLVCSNGLIRGDFTNALHIQHKGDIVGRVVESTLSLVEEAPQLAEEIQEMKAIQLSQPERLLLADYALKARFDLDPDEPNTTLYQPGDFLRVRRGTDQGSDLYTTLNVVQENAIKGGLKKYDADWKKHTTRPIQGIDQSVRINKLLWSFAEELKRVHQGN